MNWREKQIKDGDELRLAALKALFEKSWPKHMAFASEDGLSLYWVEHKLGGTYMRIAHIAREGGKLFIRQTDETERPWFALSCTPQQLKTLDKDVSLCHIVRFSDAPEVDLLDTIKPTI